MSNNRISEDDRLNLAAWAQELSSLASAIEENVEALELTYDNVADGEEEESAATDLHDYILGDAQESESRVLDILDTLKANGISY